MTKQEMFDKFAKDLFKLEPIDFIGMAYMFGVDLAEAKTDEGFDVAMMATKILNRFQTLSKDKQKEMMKICKNAIKYKKQKGDQNGNRPETESE